MSMERLVWASGSSAMKFELLQSLYATTNDKQCNCGVAKPSPDISFMYLNLLQQEFQLRLSGFKSTFNASTHKQPSQ